MRIKFSFILFNLLLINAIAQQINHKPVQLKVGEENFNASFIKQHNIKSIETTIINKPDGAIISDIGKRYEFNRQGYINAYLYTVLNRTVIDYSKCEFCKSNKRFINDTVEITIRYDTKNRPIYLNKLYDRYYYNYENDDSNLITKKIVCKKSSIDNYYIPQENALFISYETYKYNKLTEKQTKKETYYDDGYIFKKTIIHFDTNKNLVGRNIEYVSSWILEDYIYTYDNLNRVIEKSYKSNKANAIKKTYKYVYDNKNKLIKELSFKNEELIIEKNYLYNESKTLIKSEVNRDYKNDAVIIIKYKYSFY